MKTIVKALLMRALAGVARPALLKPFHKGKVVILMYHGVVERETDIPDPCMISVDKFREQVQFLSKNFEVVSFSDAVSRIHDNSVDEPIVVITFDDGYQNNFDLALPILQEAKLPATIFVATRFIDTDTTIWTGLLQSAFATTNVSRLYWREREFPLTSVQERIDSMRTVKSIIKETPQDSLLNEISDLLDALGCDPRLPADSPYRMLDSNSLESLAKLDEIELSAHTHNHFVLSRIPVPAQLEEVTTSLREISKVIGGECHTFAYPNGTKADYTDETMQILRDNGVNAAVNTEVGLCDADSSMLELNRIPVDANTDLAGFKLSLFNIQHRLKSLFGSTQSA